MNEFYSHCLWLYTSLFIIQAEIVKLIKEYKKARTCAIGDGGNDVSMIQAADVGVGIVGKEGMQASLAADFSVNQFSYISRLLCKYLFVYRILSLSLMSNLHNSINDISLFSDLYYSMAWKKFLYPLTNFWKILYYLLSLPVFPSFNSYRSISI